MTFRKLVLGLKHPLGALDYAARPLKFKLLLLRIRTKNILREAPRGLSNIFSIVELFPDLTEARIIENAGEIRRHVFDLLGSGKKELGSEIDWRRDFKTGRDWPLEPFYSLKITPGADIKVPWELSRFYHLPTLTKAYAITKGEEYAEEFEAEAIAWRRENPPYLGPNWFNAMEAGIRAANLLLSYRLFEKFRPFGVKFEKGFFRLIHEHACYILANLENVSLRSNHYLSDLVGLFYIGLLAPQLKISRRCLKIAAAGLEAEIKNQVYEDGADFESSVSYHRLATELFAFSAWLGRLNGLEFSESFLKRLEKMFEFVRSYTKPNGLAPQVGDNDDGRLHLLFEDYYDWERRDHRHLIFLAEKLFPERSWKTSRSESVAFKEAGIYFLKNKDIYILLNASPIGQRGNGGHSHNDKLSFELNYKGKDFLIDPGAYAYTADPEGRNRFRSTQKHNTLRIDGVEQNDFIAGAPFALKNQTKVRVLKWEPGRTKDELIAEHYGYKKLESPVIHRRRFSFDKVSGLLRINDELLGEGEHLIEWFFNCAEGVEVSQVRRKIELERGGSKLILGFPDGLEAEVFDDFISPSYGVKLPAKSIRLWTKSGLRVKNVFEFEIKPL